MTCIDGVQKHVRVARFVDIFSRKKATSIVIKELVSHHN